MKKFILEMFSEKGSVSMMRVMSLLCCFAAFGVAMHGLSRPQIDYSGLSMLVTSFLGPAFAGKVLQKRQESVRQANQSSVR